MPGRGLGAGLAQRLHSAGWVPVDHRVERPPQRPTEPPRQIRGDPVTDPTPQSLLQNAVKHLAPVMPLLQEVGALFAAAGYELALVGGPVRDAFLGRTSPDLDLTTDARPDDIERVLAGWADSTWDLGRAFGTIGARKVISCGASKASSQAMARSGTTMPRSLTPRSCASSTS